MFSQKEADKESANATYPFAVGIKFFFFFFPYWFITYIPNGD